MKTAYLIKNDGKRELREWLPETKLLEKSDRDSAIAQYKKKSGGY